MLTHASFDLWSHTHTHIVFLINKHNLNYTSQFPQHSIQLLLWTLQDPVKLFEGTQTIKLNVCLCHPGNHNCRKVYSRTDAKAPMHEGKHNVHVHVSTAWHLLFREARMQHFPIPGNSEACPDSFPWSCCQDLLRVDSRACNISWFQWIRKHARFLSVILPFPWSCCQESKSAKWPDSIPWSRCQESKDATYGLIPFHGLLCGAHATHMQVWQWKLRHMWLRRKVSRFQDGNQALSVVAKRGAICGPPQDTRFYPHISIWQPNTGKQCCGEAVLWPKSWLHRTPDSVHTFQYGNQALSVVATGGEAVLWPKPWLHRAPDSIHTENLQQLLQAYQLPITKFENPKEHFCNPQSSQVAPVLIG